MKKKFFILDGHHLIFRAFYAFPDLRKSNGELVNAIFGVASMTMNIIEKEKPDYLVFVFDMFKSFRHEKDSSYKAQRKECPEDLKPQIDLVYELVQKMGFQIFALDGYEADDIAATIATMNLQHDDLITYIVTGDMDAMQLINDDKIVVVTPHKGYREPIYYNESRLLEKYDLKPNEIVDFKAIAGDTSDNIKGIDGIGEVGAKNLIKQFGNLKGIYDNLDNINGAIKEKLIKGKESAFHCSDMARLRTDAPIDYLIDQCEFKGISNSVIDFFKKYEFNSLLGRFYKLNNREIGESQLALF